MYRQSFVTLTSVAAIFAAPLLLSAAGQSPATAATPGASWRAPRAADGHPDLSGTWTASAWALIPVQKGDPRDPAVGRLAAQRDRKNVGSVPDYWYEGWDKRPSQPYMLVDPADGHIPVRPDVAKTLQPDEWDVEGKIDHLQTASQLDQWARCITRGPLPFIPTSYNAGIQIVQTPVDVAILFEMIHETRVVPLDGRPHLPRDVRLWMGDSRGHWEGDTLVIDVTNFAEPDGRAVPNIVKGNQIYSGPGEKLHLVERLTRVGADSIDYSVTVEDPALYTRPYTLKFTLKKDPEYQIYEYACHEGNHFIENVLNAARVREKKAAVKK